MTRGRASSAAAFLLGTLDLRDGMGLVTAIPRSGHSPCVATDQDHGCCSLIHCKIGTGSSKDTTTSLCHIQNALRQYFCDFPFWRDEGVTIPSASVVPADVSLVEMTTWTNSPEIAAELGSRCHQQWTKESRATILRTHDRARGMCRGLQLPVA